MFVVVGFQFMTRMMMVVGAVVAGVAVVMNVRRLIVMSMFVKVFVKMFMGVAMGMLVSMRLGVVGMFMTVGMAMFMGMEMLVLVFSFHRKTSLQEYE